MLKQFIFCALLFTFGVFAVSAQQVKTPATFNGNSDSEPQGQGIGISAGDANDDGLQRIEDEFLIPQISLYPVPSSGEVYIDNPFASSGNVEFTYELYDFNTVIHWSTVSTNRSVIIPRGDLRPGLYTLRITGGGKVHFRRVVIL